MYSERPRAKSLETLLCHRLFSSADRRNPGNNSEKPKEEQAHTPPPCLPEVSHRLRWLPAVLPTAMQGSSRQIAT